MESSKLGVVKYCLCCGKEMFVKNKFINQGRGKFCSVKCNARFQGDQILKKRVRKQCLICDKLILVKPSHSKTEGFYCSIHCRSIGYVSSKIMAGKNNPNYKKGDYETNKKASVTIRGLRVNARKIKTHSNLGWEQLKAEYDFICPKCKKQEPEIILFKDHVIPISKGGHNGIDNIQPLCQRCNLKKFTKTIRYNTQLSLVLHSVENAILIEQCFKKGIKKIPEITNRIILIEEFIFLSVPRQGFSGMFIEMKAGKNKLSESQQEFKSANDRDYLFKVCYNLDEFKSEINEYLK